MARAIAAGSWLWGARLRRVVVNSSFEFAHGMRCTGTGWWCRRVDSASDYASISVAVGLSAPSPRSARGPAPSRARRGRRGSLVWYSTRVQPPSLRLWTPHPAKALYSLARRACIRGGHTRVEACVIATSGRECRVFCAGRACALDGGVPGLVPQPAQAKLHTCVCVASAHLQSVRICHPAQYAHANKHGEWTGCSRADAFVQQLQHVSEQWWVATPTS